MDDYALLSRLATSLAIGLLIGLERGWRTRDEEDRERAAGLRTFALSGLLGGIAGALGLTFGSGVLVGLVLLAFTGAFTAYHWLEARAEQNFSATSVVAGISTFLLGALAVVGHLEAAVAGAVATALLLALRDQLHRWVASLTWEEIRSVLTLLAMTFLLLPILPNRPVDPWNALNPHEIWLLTILIAALSFAGYVAVRVLGDRLGVAMAAIAGGLASSTATTVTLSGLARRHPESSALLASGVLLAGLIMVARVAVVATALSPPLLAFLQWPLLAGGGILAIGAGLLQLQGRGSSEQPELHIANPLELASALKMGALIAVVMLASRMLQHYYGGAGILAMAGISGVADVDAISISLARMVPQSLDAPLAAQAILIAVGVNTIVKAAMAGWIGGRGIGSRVGAVSLLGLAAGAGAAIWAG